MTAKTKAELLAEWHETDPIIQNENLLDSLFYGQVAGATITVVAEVTDEVDVAIQLTDINGDALAVRGGVFAYLSDDANGDSIAGTAPSAGWDIDTDGLLIPIIADKYAQFVSEADGDIDITIGEAGADVWYMIVVLPDGTLVASDAITFT